MKEANGDADPKMERSWQWAEGDALGLGLDAP